MDDRPPNLDDPAFAHAWVRFRRLLAWMGVASAGAVVLGLIWLEIEYGPLSWVTIVGTVLGLTATIMLAAVLMGLIFLSSGTGYDETVDDLPDKQKDRQRP